jgi:hypothetical protein
MARAPQNLPTAFIVLVHYAALMQYPRYSLTPTTSVTHKRCRSGRIAPKELPIPSCIRKQESLIFLGCLYSLISSIGYAVVPFCGKKIPTDRYLFFNFPALVFNISRYPSLILPTSDMYFKLALMAQLVSEGLSFEYLLYIELL